MKRASQAEKVYQKFHGRGSSRKTMVDFSPPKSLVSLGRAVAVEYESSKRLYGTHKPRLYRHKFGSGVQILAHPNGKWLLVYGGRFRISDWLRG